MININGITSKFLVFGGLALMAPAIASANISDWFQVGDANWTESNGIIQADQGKGFLVTKKPYQDFMLSVEFKADLESNSGVFFRCSNPNALSDKSCYEANIFDKRPDQSGRTGGIVNLASPKVSINTEGRWNKYEIKAVGSRLQVWLNGTLTVDKKNDDLNLGPIGLQFASGKIQFRKFKVTEWTKSIQYSDEIRGIWDLTGFELNDGNGAVTPWCEGSHGTIIYYLDYMSVSINCKSDPSKMVLYSGPYHLEGTTVIHNVQNFSAPGLNHRFRREVEMPHKDELLLIGPFGEGGKAIVSWKRR